MSDDSLKATGEIDQDGNFSLTTYRDNASRAGAVEGQHKVIVEPAIGDTKPIIALTKPYTVEPRDNEITIEVPLPKRR